MFLILCLFFSFFNVHGAEGYGAGYVALSSGGSSVVQGVNSFYINPAGFSIPERSEISINAAYSGSYG